MFAIGSVLQDCLIFEGRDRNLQRGSLYRVWFKGYSNCFNDKSKTSLKNPALGNTQSYLNQPSVTEKQFYNNNTGFLQALLTSGLTMRIQLEPKLQTMAKITVSRAQFLLADIPIKPTVSLPNSIPT